MSAPKAPHLVNMKECVSTPMVPIDASVPRATPDQDVNRILTSATASLVRTWALVLMEEGSSLAFVCQVTPEKDVKLILTNVAATPAKATVFVLI